MVADGLMPDGPHQPGDLGSARTTRLVLLGVGIVLAVVLRLVLLPLEGWAGDLDLFISWAGWIASHGLGPAYELPLSFPPVLPWIWAGLGAIDPGLATAPASDPSAHVLMKLPATLADIGLAALVGWWLRERPSWAIAGVLSVLLSPVVIGISAWWGQFESLYVLPALAAVVLAARGRLTLAAALAAVALMTKPQALPLVIPIAAWIWATSSWRGRLKAAIAGSLVVAVLWLPFLPYGGLTAYLGGLGRYEDQLYGVISLRAWNPWWLAQLAAPSTDYVRDAISIAGPITLRSLGVVATLILLTLVIIRLARRPTPAVLAWSMAAAALVAFCCLTTMHERYSFPALIFLPLLWPRRLAVATWLVLVGAVTANLVAAVPPTGDPGSLIPLGGPVGVAGSLAITGSMVACLVGLYREPIRAPAVA